ncbi:MAG: phosphate/phosphite/phosphonate ABC transporter substrate-binding protein, partial [Alphaproteobacteria bacterium]|nr:phosphate/phosphite/phosphonate ABC transporter substrate-binding protein [Alphaproteobacteria bacterium]
MPLILARGAVADRPLTLGVLAWRGVSETTTRWRPLADYLSVALGGRPVRLVAAGFPDLSGQLDRDELDFVLTNPSHYIMLRGANTLSGALATAIILEDGHSVSAFGGVILTLAGRHDIARIQDLDGRTIAAVAESSLGGWQAQLYELSRRGVRPPTGDRRLLTGMPHDRVVEAVLAGSVDAGFVRTGLIEAMARQGTLDPTRIKVVEPQDHPGFPFASSTRLFPEWPFVALPHVDHEVARRVAAALLLLDASHPAARQADI